MVKDINSLPQTGIVDSLGIDEIKTTANNKVFFYANDSVHGPELWVSDGTAGGTKLIEDLMPGKYGVRSIYLSHNNSLLFNFGGLHITDGDTILDISDISIASSDLVELNGQLLFYGTGSSGGLATTDGTPANTKIIRKIQILSNYVNYRSIYLVKLNNYAYFSGQNPDSTVEMGLWRTDGTENGTSLICATPNYPIGITLINGKLYFKTMDPITREVETYGNPMERRQAQGKPQIVLPKSLVVSFTGCYW